MKKLILPALLAGIGMAAMLAFKPATPPSADPVKWYTWDEAVKLNETQPKKMFIDVYTDWCGWCKRMDRTTFEDPAVAEYLTANYYPVKLNAEQKEDIQFNGENFKYVDSGNGRGVHSLAYALLDGRLGYPTVVYLNEKYERIMISPGFKEAGDMLKELKFAAEEKYREMTWEQYRDMK